MEECLSKHGFEKHVFMEKIPHTEVYRIHSHTNKSHTNKSNSNKFEYSAKISTDISSLGFERMVLEKMGKIGISPKIRDFLVCNGDMGVIVMDRYESISLNSSEDVEEIFRKLARKIGMMHKNYVVHNNLNLGNIVLRKTEPFIINFERSEIKPLIQKDLIKDVSNLYISFTEYFKDFDKLLHAQRIFKRIVLEELEIPIFPHLYTIEHGPQFNIKNGQIIVGGWALRTDDIPKDFWTNPNNDTVFELNLSDNNLEYIPSQIKNFKNLRILDLRFNLLKSLPESIGELKHLEALLLNKNNLEQLSPTIKNLYSLKHVM